MASTRQKLPVPGSPLSHTEVAASGFFLAIVIATGLLLTCTIAINANLIVPLAQFAVYIISGVVAVLCLCRRNDSLIIYATIFLSAFVTRSALLYYVFVTAEPGSIIHLTPDEERYFFIGNRIANIWHDENIWRLSLLKDVTGSKNFLQYLINALHIHFLGEAYIFPRTTCAFFDAIACIYAIRIARRYTTLKIAFAIGLAVAFNPQLVYWSGRNFHDPLIALCCLGAIDAFIQFTSHSSIRSLMWLVLFLLLLFFDRFYISVFLTGILLLALLFNNAGQMKKRVFYLLSIIIAIGFVGTFIGVHKTVKNAYDDIGGVEHLKKSAEIAGSKKQYSTSIIQGFGLKSIVISGVHYMLSPSPLNPGAGGVYRLLTLGNLYWYIICVFLAGGMVYCFKQGIRELYPVILFILLCMVLYSLLPTLSEPRHRMQMTHMATIISVIGYAGVYRLKTVIGMLSVGGIVLGFLAGELVRRGIFIS
jgi:hypothetical protein